MGVCQPQIVIVVAVPQNEVDRVFRTLDVETRDSLEPSPRWTHLHGKGWVTGYRWSVRHGKMIKREYVPYTRAHSFVYLH